MLADPEFVTVVLAGLLHDIGKFLQRGRFLTNSDGRHPEVSATFVSAFSGAFGRVADAGLLRELVLRHHRGHRFAGLRPEDAADERVRVLATLISKADGLSASERGQHSEQWQDFRTTPLAPVFDRLFTPELISPRHRLQPRGLAGSRDLTNDLFPALWHEYQGGELDGLLREFGERCHRLLADCPEDPTAVVTHLLALLNRYTWAIASDTQETVPDISLFDHLKTTAALAACLYLYHREQGTLTQHAVEAGGGQPFCLVTGDFSGIQNYIFDIATGDDPGKGVARRLRARSFAIQALSEIVPQALVEAAGLPPANIVMSSGGKFRVLVPNLPGTLERLHHVMARWEQWFLDEYRGELSLNLVWTPFGEDDLLPGPGQGFGRLIGRTAEQLARQKSHQLAAHLTTRGQWQEEQFLLRSLSAAPCTSCGKFPRRHEDLCSHCQADLDWGRLLPQATGLAIYLRPGAGSRPMGPASVSLVRDHAGATGADLVLKLNDAETQDLSPQPAAFRYVVSHVPAGAAGDVLTFEEIAAQATGRKLLGFLKLDVDRLGEAFAFGLRDWDTMSRITTLSRMLDLFFTGWVQHLLETEFPTCYAVFSGGDDVFIVGPWDRTLTFAVRLADDFRRFTGDNPHLSISGGLVLGTDHYPMGQAAREADALVERSKHRAHSAGGGWFTLLGHTLPWEDLRRVLDTWEELRPELRDVSQGFLHGLVRYGAMWQQRDLRLQPLLAYSISREGATPAFRRWAEQFIGIRPLEQEQRRILDSLGLLGQLWLYAKGGGKA